MWVYPMVFPEHPTDQSNPGGTCSFFSLRSGGLHLPKQADTTIGERCLPGLPGAALMLPCCGRPSPRPQLRASPAGAAACGARSPPTLLAPASRWNQPATRACKNASLRWAHWHVWSTAPRPAPLCARRIQSAATPPTCPLHCSTSWTSTSRCQCSAGWAVVCTKRGACSTWDASALYRKLRLMQEEARERD